MPVGSSLALIRREQGKTLEEVAEATKIVPRILTSLENDRLDDLPPVAYVRGYIRNYAQFLRVDPAPLLEEFARDTAARPERVSTPRVLAARAVVPRRQEVHTLPKQAWMAIAAALVVVGLVVWGISAFVGRDQTPPPIPPESTSTATPGTETSAAVNAVGETGQPAAGSFVLAISVASGQTSWMQIRVDSLIAYEGTLPAGSVKQWTVSKDAVIRISKPSAVTVTRNGKTVTMPKSSGISQITLTAGQ